MADNATDFRCGGDSIVDFYTPMRVTDDYQVRVRTSGLGGGIPATGLIWGDGNLLQWGENNALTWGA